MPANLTPQYLEADRRFKTAATPQERLAALESMLATIPKHKGTEKMQADIKRRIAKLRVELQRRKGPARGKPTYHMDREGAGQIVLVGAPNVGKSSLLRALTNAEPEIADYPFSTRAPLPGMMAFENVQVQLVDLPPVSMEFSEGWFYAIIRTADAAALVVDLATDDLLAQTDDVRRLLAEANLALVAAPGLPGRLRAIVIANKLDARYAGQRLELFREYLDDALPVIPVSAEQGTGLDGLRQALFDLLGKIRVYSKPPGKKADRDTPFILPRGATVRDAAVAVHRDFIERLKYARLWSTVGHVDGMMVGRDHVLQDGDVIEIHT